VLLYKVFTVLLDYLMMSKIIVENSAVNFQKDTVSV